MPSVFSNENSMNENKLPNEDKIEHRNTDGATELLNAEVQSESVSIESSTQKQRIEEPDDLTQEKSESNYPQMMIESVLNCKETTEVSGHPRNGKFIHTVCTCKIIFTVTE